MISYILVDYASLFFKKRKSKESHNQRLKTLTTNLISASKEVDSILTELANVAEVRESSIQKLETELNGLEQKEVALKTEIEILQKTPLPVAHHFARLLENGESKSRKRDYLLFSAGGSCYDNYFYNS